MPQSHDWGLSRYTINEYNPCYQFSQISITKNKTTMTLTYYLERTSDGKKMEWDVDYLGIQQYDLKNHIEDTEPDFDTDGEMTSEERYEEWYGLGDDDVNIPHQYLESEGALKDLDDALEDIINELMDNYTDPKPYIKRIFELRSFLQLHSDQIVWVS